jgi:hypothetical protein
MDQTCPVVHKSRRPQARLKTVTLFYIHCGIGGRDKKRAKKLGRIERQLLNFREKYNLTTLFFINFIWRFFLLKKPFSSADSHDYYSTIIYYNNHD